MSVDRLYNVPDERWRIRFNCFSIDSSRPACRHFDFDKLIDTFVDCFVVHCNDLVAFFTVGFLDGFFKVCHSIFDRKNIGQFEEGRLHDHVDSAAKADFFCKVSCIDDVHLCFSCCNRSFQRSRQVCIKLFCTPDCIENKLAAFLRPLTKSYLST